jgi:hypothetical protein
MNDDIQVMVCPHCNKSISFKKEQHQTLVDCPHCGKEVSLVWQWPRFQPPIEENDFNPISLFFDDSVIAGTLTFFAVLDFIGAVIGGFMEGTNDVGLGFLIFICGVFGGLILLGFARIVKRVFECSERLEKIEMLFEKIYKDKK